ncbi:hypothetical protein GMOD_00003099 [Pyrenophora seminiperda CCB06]|uniref:Uncharacterized protein n=1 Tax=Pyrenophora seminiperda CCB06 TaxID=1302712 RepID=A0A3M7M3X7_9PLEO|nr:hypothetical protein GMOD_00003099 [Pyrenophora seminiperda CCB06]
MDNSGTEKRAPAPEDETMEQQGQERKKLPRPLSIDTGLASENWGLNTTNSEESNETLFYTPSTHSHNGSLHSSPSNKGRASKRPAKPTYNAPTKASEAKKQEKVDLSAIGRSYSSKGRVNQAGSGHGPSPPLFASLFGHRGDTFTDEVLERASYLERDREELVKEVASLRATEDYVQELELSIDELEDQLEKLTREKETMDGELEATNNKLETLTEESDIERQELDIARRKMEELSEEFEQLLTDVEELKQQKKTYWRDSLPDASAQAVAIADLERHNAEMSQALKEKDKELAVLQEDKDRVEKELEALDKEMLGTVEYAQQGQDELDELREALTTITERQQHLIRLLSKLIENSTQSISDGSDIYRNEVLDLLRRLDSESETRGLHANFHELLQAFGKSRSSLQTENEDLENQLHDIKRYVTRLEEAAKAPQPGEIGMSTPSLLSPASPLFPRSPQQADRDGFEKLYTDAVQKNKITLEKLEQARLEVAELKGQTDKMTELEMRLEDSQKARADLEQKVDEFKNEAQQWRSEVDEKNSELDLRSVAFEEQAKRERREVLRHIKAYYNKTRDETNWHVIDLQEKLSALEEEHESMKQMFNQVKTEKASLEEEIVRRKVFAMDPSFIEHTNAIRQKNATHGPLPSLSSEVHSEDDDPPSFTPTTPTFLRARKQLQKKIPTPRYQLEGVKAAHHAQAAEFREQLRQQTARDNDILAFSKNPPPMPMDRTTRKVFESSVPPPLPAHPNLVSTPTASKAHPNTPATGTFSTSRFFSPPIQVTTTAATPLTSRFFPPTNIPGTSTSSLFPPITPNTFASRDVSSSEVFIIQEIINKMRREKMGKKLYPPGKSAYEAIKGWSMWDMWEGSKWAEECASVREIQILRERGIIE